MAYRYRCRKKKFSHADEEKRKNLIVLTMGMKRITDLASFSASNAAVIIGKSVGSEIQYQNWVVFGTDT